MSQAASASGCSGQRVHLFSREHIYLFHVTMEQIENVLFLSLTESYGGFHTVNRAQFIVVTAGAVRTRSFQAVMVVQAVLVTISYFK
jgi:hypothetical protein